MTNPTPRALMTFGNPFGLALYDKSRANVADDTQPTPSSGIADALSMTDRVDLYDDFTREAVAFIEGCDTFAKLTEWKGRKDIDRTLKQMEANEEYVGSFEINKGKYIARYKELQPQKEAA